MSAVSATLRPGEVALIGGDEQYLVDRRQSVIAGVVEGDMVLGSESPDGPAYSRIRVWTFLCSPGVDIGVRESGSPLG